MNHPGSSIERGQHGLESASRFWVLGNSVHDLSGSCHTRYICENPWLFELPLDDVSIVQGRGKEDAPHDVEARRRLLRHALSQGWLKVQRFLQPRTYWTIEADSVERRKHEIRNFLAWATERALLSLKTELFLIGEEDPVQLMRFSWANGGIERFLLEGVAVSK